jgi:two-component system, chemotaxis family, protein-glutamate methylesterase/glutaminase
VHREAIRTGLHLGATGPDRLASAFEDAAFGVVAIACSAGGQAALRELLAGLPDRFPAAVVVLLHWPAEKPLKLTSLERVSVLPITLTQEGQSLKPATVFFAAPGRHLLIKPNGSILLSQTPRLHFVRPSADLLFESVAASYGNRAIAVILTGVGRDGSIGVRSVKAAGGPVLAQDQATAAYFAMPKAAIATGCVDHVLPLEQIAPTLVSLVNDTTTSNGRAHGSCGTDSRVADD